MTTAVREAINTLARQLRAEAKIEQNALVEVVFVCNPVMHHLLLGIDPVELGQAPFALASSNWFSRSCGPAQKSRRKKGESDVEWSGVEWSGVEWSGVDWSGVEWSGVQWSGVEWIGVQRRGVE